MCPVIGRLNFSVETSAFQFKVESVFAAIVRLILKLLTRAIVVIPGLVLSSKKILRLLLHT